MSKDDRHRSVAYAALVSVDLRDRLAEAELADLVPFLALMLRHGYEEYVREYCRIIDARYASHSLRQVSGNGLCVLLWTLTYMGDWEGLQTVHDPVVSERLVEMWNSDDFRGAIVLGIVTLTRPEVRQVLPFSPLTSGMRKKLAPLMSDLFETEQLCTLALVLRGLRAYDEAEAQLTVRQCLPLWETADLFADAIESALTPRSLKLLQETLDWLSARLYEETIECVDQLESAFDHAEESGDAENLSL